MAKRTAAGIQADIAKGAFRPHTALSNVALAYYQSDANSFAIQAAIEAYPKSWKRAKLFLLESLCRRFAYEVDTKTGPLSLAMHDRAELWRKDFEALKKEVSAESCSVPKFANGVHNKPPYFYTGMQQNERARHR